MTRACAIAVCLLLAVRAAPVSQTVFSGHSTVRFTLEAPFDELFAAESKDPEATVEGRLSYENDGRQVTVPGIRVSVRGNTSRSDKECTFPKLKLRFSDHPDGDALFSGIATIKIGTHCGESRSDTLTRNGRLPNQRSPHREAFAYRLLQILGVPTLEARPAQIEYRDSSRGVAARPPLVRDALLLEDDDQARHRIGGKRVINEDEFTSVQQMLSPRNAIDIAFGEAALGNFDWCLKFTPEDAYRCDARHPLWNIVAFERPEGPAAALMYDFDTSGIVAGRHLWFNDIFNPRFFGNGGAEAAIEVTSQLQRTRTLFSRTQLDEARRRFASRAETAYQALQEADVDPEGVETIRRYVEPFFKAMSNDADFYLPVVVRRGTQLWKDAAATNEACPGGGPAPIGTLTGPPLDRSGTAARVVILDSLWHWTGKRKCPAILNGPVWIDAGALGSDYPQR